jgi:iron complex outermembrane recepter protein
MRKSQVHQLSTLSAAVASALVTVPVAAQQEQRLLEEVLVTATRRSESIQDIPFNITALGGQAIERERISNLSDLARRVPGMTVVDKGARGGSRMTVRGLNVDSMAAAEALGNSSGDTVGTYLGEVPVYWDLKPVDLNRIEVLMGPQGTLYGAGTLGGAVRYIPNKPQADGMTFELRGNAYDLSESSGVGYDLGGTINIPIIEDRFAIRGSIDYNDDPGFIDYNYLVREPGVSLPQPDPEDRNANLKKEEDANTEETLAARLAARYTGDVLDATLTYYYQNQDVGARQINHKDAFGTDDYESAHRYLEPNERENQMLALELVADLGFAELTSATAYSEFEEKGQRDQSDLLLDFEYGYEEFPSFAAFTREDGEDQRTNQELRLVSTGDSKFNWIVGVFYNKFETDGLSQEFTPGFDQFAVDNLGGVQLRPDALEYYELQEIETEETAIYGEVSYDFTDRWQVTLGARYFEYEDERLFATDIPLTNTVYFGAPQDLIDPVGQRNKVDDDGSLFKINTSYYFTDDIMAFATISEGFRLGGLNSVVPCSEVPDPGEGVQKVCALPDEILIEPDTTTNYELGVHSTFERALVNASIYYIDWEDIQVADVTENGAVPITGNGGTAESYGLELSTQWQITNSLTFYGSYAYNKAELTESAPGLVGGVDGEDGDRLAASPEHQGSLALNYAMGLSDGSELNLDWSMTAQSDVYTKVGLRNFGEELSGFALHNISASWFKDNWTTTLYADNVLDKYAETSVRTDTSFIRQVGLFDMRRYYKNVSRPREIGLRVIYRFDG